MAGNIRQLDAPSDLGLRPSETGVEATAGAARRIGGFYNQAADAYNQAAGLKQDLGNRIGGAVKDVGQVAVDYMDHQEINQGAAKGAEMVANLTNQWNQKLRDPKFDPNDATAAAQFRQETLEPALDKFKEGFSTEKSQDWADHFVNQYRQHMVEKTSADMSTMAGIAVKTNAEKTVNALSSTVANDPSSLDFALKAVDHSLGGMVDSSPTLDPAAAAGVKTEVTQKAKEAIVKSAVSGMIQKNPNIDLDAVQKKYGDYVNGAEIKMFQKAAQTQAKVDAYHDKSAAIAQRQLDDQQVHSNAAKVISSNVAVDPQTNQVTINPKFFDQALQIARQNPDAPSAAATVRTMLDWGESQLNKERKPVTDPMVASSIDAKMFTSDNPTTKMDILKAEAAGKLTRADAEIRTKIIDQRDKLPSDPQFKLAMDGAKELIEGRSAGEKSLQAGKYAAFMQQFLSEYQQQKAAGTLQPNALSLRDPASLLSKSMEAYKSPLANAVAGNGGITTAPVAPKVSGQEVPAPLRGIAALQYNPSKGLWRDQASGAIYDASGQAVKP